MDTDVTLQRSLHVALGSRAVDATVGSSGELHEVLLFDGAAVAQSRGLSAPPYFVVWRGGCVFPATHRLCLEGSLLLHSPNSTATATVVRVVQLASADPGGAVVRVGLVNVTGRGGAPLPPFLSLEEQYEGAGGLARALPLDFVHSPSLRKLDRDIACPHWQWKTGTVVVQNGATLLAVVANASAYDGDALRRFPPNLQLEYPTATARTAPPLLSFLVAASALTSHSIYGRTSAPLAWSRAAAPHLDYAVLWRGDAPARAGFRDVVRWAWRAFGRPAFREASAAAAQQNYRNRTLTLWSRWRVAVWDESAEYLQQHRVYLDVPCPAPVNASLRCGTLRCFRNVWADHVGCPNCTNDDLWLNAWFQTLRTALGLLLYGERGAPEQASRARAVLRLALSAPPLPPSGDAGGFPTVYWLGGDNSSNWFFDSGWAGLCNEVPHAPEPRPACQDYLHGFDMAWSGVLALKFRRALQQPRGRRAGSSVWLGTRGPGAAALRGSPEDAVLARDALRLCERLGRFFVAQQRPDGGFPAWWHVPDLAPAREMRDTSAETGGVALFLAELAAATQQPQYLGAAKAAMGFVEREIVPERKWFDFETFTSCSPKPFGFHDNLTNQWPQNNLGKIQATFAAARLHELTGDAHFLELGRVLLDFALLQQQVWQHPLLSPNLLGGFTTQNTDAEWSDARLAYFADLLFVYYFLTRDLEYLERGVAALHAGFSIAPFENWAHTGGGGGDHPGALSSYHWGSGSALATVEFWAGVLADAYVFVPDGHAVCINGCTLDILASHAGTLQLAISSPFCDAWKEDLNQMILVLDDSPEHKWDVVVNGHSLGVFQGNAHVPVPTDAFCC